MPRVIYGLACCAFFGVGAYIWKVKNTGLTPAAKDAPEQVATPAPEALQHGTGIVVEVGSEKITQDDVEWEYQLVTEGIEDKESLTPIPDLGDKLQAELAPLRKALIANLIERKLLFTYLQQDKAWNFDEPSRYTQCMTEWQSSFRDNARLAQNPGSKTRLKNRLCERSILDQYMKERLFKEVKVEEAEVVEYYKNHIGEFKKPERIEVRQIVLPTEAEANKVRNQATAHNFAELAKEHSIAPEAVDGGHLGPLSKTALPSVFDMAFHLRKGEISSVLKSPYGYHIILLLEKYNKLELSLEQAHEQIADIIRKKKEEDEYQKWVEKALATITVTTPKPLW